MKVNATNGVSAQAGAMKHTQAMDSVSRNIQAQIDNAQKQLQELSSNQELSAEEKMKKRQEIQKQIADLNSQLRQHEIELRKEKQQKKGTSMDDMLGGKTEAKQAGGQRTGLSQTSMQSMISADAAMDQAKIQGSTAAKSQNRAGVLKAEIKLDKKPSAKKQEELAEAEQTAANAAAAQMGTLAKANQEMKEADKTEAASEDKKEEKTEKERAEKEKAVNEQITAGYTQVDIRL